MQSDEPQRWKSDLELTTQKYGGNNFIKSFLSFFGGGGGGGLYFPVTKSLSFQVQDYNFRSHKHSLFLNVHHALVCNFLSKGDGTVSLH